jgi:hypothetical protein
MEIARHDASCLAYLEKRDTRHFGAMRVVWICPSLSNGSATQVWYALTYVGGFVALFSAILALIQYLGTRR